jgi:hypothetical protein
LIKVIDDNYQQEGLFMKQRSRNLSSRNFVLMPGLVLIVAFSIVLIAQIRSTSLDLKEGDPSNTLVPEMESSYEPSVYGLPNVIAGYRVLAVLTPENTACMVPGSRRLVLQALAQNVEGFLQDTGMGAVQQELANLEVATGVTWQFSFVGPNSTKERIISGIATLNAHFRENECIRLGGP